MRIQVDFNTKRTKRTSCNTEINLYRFLLQHVGDYLEDKCKLRCNEKSWRDGIRWIFCEFDGRAMRRISFLRRNLALNVSLLLEIKLSLTIRKWSLDYIARRKMDLLSSIGKISDRVFRTLQVFFSRLLAWKWASSKISMWDNIRRTQISLNSLLLSGA